MWGMAFQSTNNYISWIASKSPLNLNSFTKGLQTAAGKTKPVYYFYMLPSPGRTKNGFHVLRKFSFDIFF